MKPPNWAVPATQWHIDRGIYNEAFPDDVDESVEFHRQTVFRHRMWEKAIKPALAGDHDHDGRYLKDIAVEKVK